MDLPVKIVMGRNSIFNPQTRTWLPGKCWLCVLAEKPYRIVRVPMFAVRNEVAAGDEYVVLDLIDCDWATEFFNDEWRRRMAMGETS